MELASPAIKDGPQQDDRIRWATLMALTMLQNNRELLDQLAKQFEGAAQDVGTCIRLLETSAAAYRPGDAAGAGGES